MIQILKSSNTPIMGGGTFKLRMIRPGQIHHKPLDDSAFGSLSRIDHANLGVGALVSMHLHRNDEILSYMWKGEMVHRDSTGQEVVISPNRLMMMNAGSSFYHEEAVPEKKVEMLQIFIRPREKDLPPRVQFYDRPLDFRNSEWKLIGGPEESNAPLTIYQQIYIYDAHPQSGDTIEVPSLQGLTPWVYIMEGAVQVGEHSLIKGDAITDSNSQLPPFQVTETATLVAFLIDQNAPFTMAGLFSGVR
ncbi:pirin family protein [Paenibacillus spongiae]|uniref:Pirin family protein n=1 Tax=Paenibacillus spongiae TaxID=2909671 RepID=A0ABY5SGM7_9BACL|nr:pirin family protein [Paenibacillus spongiae]UVI33137.1 pirin family protein [Paenibacillus spongiae]